MLAAKIPKQCCSNKFTKYARVLIQVVMMMQHHVLEWVSHLQSPTVTWREEKKKIDIQTVVFIRTRDEFACPITSHGRFQPF